MASYSTLTVVSGTTITSAWGNNVRNTVLSRETGGDPSSVSEAQQWARTDEDILYRGTGVASEAWDGYGAWKSYSPTLANSAGTSTSVGNGTLTGAYRHVGGRAVAFWAKLELGSTTTWWSAGDATPAISLPVAMSTNLIRHVGSLIQCTLASTSNTVQGYAVWGSSTQVFAYVPQTGGTYPTLTAVLQNTPHAHGSGFMIAFAGVYESAS